MIRVLVYTDQRFVGEALAVALGEYSGMRVVATALDVHELPRLIRRCNPSVFVADTSVPGCLSTIRDVAMQDTACVVAVSVPETEHHIVECLEAGAAGYVVKNGSVEDIAKAIQRAVAGELLCEPRVAASLSRRAAGLACGLDLVTGKSLTGRERQIVELIDQGLSNKEIARRLGIKIATVKNHVHSILEKLHVNRRGEAAALMRGRVPLSEPTEPQAGART